MQKPKKKRKHDLEQPMKDLKGLEKGKAQKPFDKKQKKTAKEHAF